MRWAIPLLLAALGWLIPFEAHAIGLLVPNRPEIDPLMIRYHRVDVTIRERIAETRVEQTFRNHTSQTLEATYIFPIPAGATVSGFAMWVNGVRQQGELLDAAQARSIYEQIVARAQDPGLVEHMGGNLFRARVFPILPLSEQRIEISFTQTLEYDGSVVHYRYPLRTEGPAARTLEDMTVRANIVSRTAIRAVYSPSHAISIARPDDHHATIGFEGNAQTLDTDFDLYYAVQDRDVGLSLLTHRGGAEDGYFLAMIAPRTEVTDREIAAKEVLFVFDTSGSMSGEKMDRARTALDYMLQRLNPTDHFQVVRFSTDVEPLFDGGASVPANPQNVAAARAFARRFVAAGGTAIQPALVEALRTRAPAGGLPRMVVFMTDGMPTIGETAPDRIVAEVTRLSGDTSRLFVFGVGNDVNTTFLDLLAQRNRGLGDYFRDGAEMERRMSAFYDRIAFPLLTDLRLAFPGLNTYDIYPRDLGHLYRGSQLLVVGRYRGEGASRVTLNGRIAHEREPRAFAFDVNFPGAEPDNDFLPRLWATRKIGYLLDEIRLHGERAELRDECVQLARRFGIVTPYTSYLVVEDGAVPPGVIPTTVPPPEQPQLNVDARDRVLREQEARRQFQGGQQFGMNRPARDPAPAAPSRRPAEEAQAEADFESFGDATVGTDDGGGGGGGGFARGGGSGGGRSTTSVAPRFAPPAPPQTIAPSGGGGEAGRRLSTRLRSMREAEQVAPSATRFVLGRAFREIHGMWVDSMYQRGRTELRIRYASPAYFALLRARPDLRPALSLGQRVTVAVDARRVIIVDTQSQASANNVDEAALRRFLSD